LSNFYAIKYTDYRYMLLSLDALDIIENAPEGIGLQFEDIMRFSKRDTRFESWWEAPETTFTPNEGIKEHIVPDVVIWQAGAALVLSPKAYRLLGDILKPLGELLPVTIMDEPESYWIFNCLARKDADPSKSAWEYLGDKPVRLKKVGFSVADDDPVIFKTDFDNSSFLYCGERFKAVVEQFELQGISFSPL